jgi:hypothetical protein
MFTLITVAYRSIHRICPFIKKFQQFNYDRQGHSDNSNINDMTVATVFFSLQKSQAKNELSEVRSLISL